MSTEFAPGTKPFFGVNGVFARQLKSGWRAYVVYEFTGYSDHSVWGNPAGQMLHLRWRVIRSTSDRDPIGKPIVAPTLEDLKTALRKAVADRAVSFGDADASEQGWG
jgi:hypothetical protein